MVVSSPLMSRVSQIGHNQTVQTLLRCGRLSTASQQSLHCLQSSMTEDRRVAGLSLNAGGVTVLCL